MARVVITGAGTVNALGLDVASTTAAMQAGACAIGPLDLAERELLSITIGAQIKGWDATARFDIRALSLYDPVTQYALTAAREAVAQSGLTLDEATSYQSGVIMGTAAGGIQTWNDAYRAVYQDAKSRVHPLTVPRLMSNAAASHLSMEFGLKGPVLTVSTACAASNHAIGLAFQMIRSGMARVMLAGGAEAMLCFGGIKAWEGLRVLSPDGCRPFCADRNGLVIGDGAAVFVLEDYDHATARGAEILAEVAGFAMTSDASDIVLPSQDGAARAISGAMADAGLTPDQIGYINAHGTGTAANDRTEAAAIQQVFGAVAAQVPVSSTKSMHGHLIGATGAVELLACLMALRDGILAPTVNFTNPDPAIGLDIIANSARQKRVSAVLSNAFAFGGLNAVLALRQV